MTKRKKLALLKKGAELLEPALKEEAALAPLRQKGAALTAAEGLAHALPLDRLKRYGLLAGGALLILSTAESAVRAESTRLIAARELKRQLKPIQEKLDELERELAEIKSRL